jgi:hypothetical protein
VSLTPNYDSECENEIQAQLSLMVITVDNLIILFESIINVFLKVSARSETLVNPSRLFCLRLISSKLDLSVDVCESSA